MSNVAPYPPERVPSAMFIGSMNQAHDIELAAHRNAARSGRAVMVHYHPQMDTNVSVADDIDPDANERVGGMQAAACNDKCHIVEPDPMWPPGHEHVRERMEYR